MCFSVSKCACELACECVCVWSDWVSCQQSPPRPRLPSVSISDRQRATFLNRTASDRQRLGVEERGGRAEGRILHCKPSPDSRLFGSFISKATACQPFAHHTAYIHTHLLTGGHTVGSIHCSFQPFKSRCLLWCVSQWAHEYILCWTD